MNELLQQAVQARQAEAAKERPRFDACPPYRQNTAFHPAEIIALRRAPLTERLEASRAKRVEGNSAFAAGRLLHAKRLYEESYSIFCYVEPQNDRWKSGIRDADMIFADIDDGGREHPGVVAHLAGLLCNIALVAARMNHRSEARAALDEVLGAPLRCADHLRAAYLLAKLIAVDDPSASTADVKKAIATLESAVAAWAPPRERTPEDEAALGECNALLVRLVAERDAATAQERRRFGKMFESPLRPPRAASATSSQAMPRGDAPAVGLGGTWFEQAERCRAVVAAMRAEGRAAQAATMERQLTQAACEKLFVEVARPLGLLDFDRPSPLLGPHAARLQLDLADPQVLHELSELRLRHHCEGEVGAMSIADVETELLARGVAIEPLASHFDMRTQSRTSGRDPTRYTPEFSFEMGSLARADAPPAHHAAALRKQLSEARRAGRW